LTVSDGTIVTGADILPVSTPSADATDASILDGKRALVVDDVDLNREIVLSIFKKTKFIVSQAEDGVEALEMYTSDPTSYDIVIMDLRMPNMDGFECADRIRKSGLSNAATIPIIALTADSGAHIERKCKDSGMNAVAYKPVQFDEFRDLVVRHLAGKG
jgi:CheY-like chemotaxis protein